MRNLNEKATTLEQVLVNLRDLKERLLTSDYFERPHSIPQVYNNIKQNYNSLLNNNLSDKQQIIKANIEKELKELDNLEKGKYPKLTNDYNRTRQQLVSYYMAYKYQKDPTVDYKEFEKADKLYTELKALRHQIIHLNSGESRKIIEEKLSKEQQIATQNYEGGKSVENISFHDMHRFLKHNTTNKPEEMEHHKTLKR